MAVRPSYAELRARIDAPPGSSWGLFGDIGTLARLDPACARRGAGCVRTGEVFPLDLPLDAFEPNIAVNRSAPRHTILSRSRYTRDDVLDNLFLQGSTQLDGLRHFRHWEHGFYNGVRDDEVAVGTERLGVGQWAAKGIVCRAVLVDLARWAAMEDSEFDPARWRTYSVADLERAMDHQGVRLEHGDALLLRTGWLDTVLRHTPSQRQEFRERNVSPGLEQSEEMAAWLWDTGVCLVAADNMSVESLPPRPESPFVPDDEGHDVPFPGLMHHVLIPLLGLALGELWNLDPLAEACAADGRWDVLLTASPLGLIGGVGSPPNAIATR